MGLDMAYCLGDNIHDGDGTPVDEEVKAEYLDAYERYKQSMKGDRVQRQENGGSDGKQQGGAEDSER